MLNRFGGKKSRIETTEYLYVQRNKCSFCDVIIIGCKTEFIYKGILFHLSVYIFLIIIVSV
jgi:hypothetical protein